MNELYVNDTTTPTTDETIFFIILCDDGYSEQDE